MQSCKEEGAVKDNLAELEPADEPSVTEEKNAPQTRVCQDEPISEEEFNLLFVDLSNSTVTDPALDPSRTDTPCLMLSNKVSQPVGKRGRGRPRGSTNKVFVQRAGKKQHKKVEMSKHSDYVLPDRLKTRAKVESDIIIDLTKRSVAPIVESGFDLKDKVDLKTWKLLDKKAIVCTLCCKAGNFAVLGPLFGPYKVHVEKASNEAKDLRGQKAEKLLHVRLHSDCAIWTPGLCFVGSDLVGVGRALNDAAKMVNRIFFYIIIPFMLLLHYYSFGIHVI